MSWRRKTLYYGNNGICMCTYPTSRIVGADCSSLRSVRAKMMRGDAGLPHGTYRYLYGTDQHHDNNQDNNLKEHDLILRW